MSNKSGNPLEKFASRVVVVEDPYSTKETRTPTKPVIFKTSKAADKYTEQNKEAATDRFLQWDGIQTRHRFTSKEEEVREWIEQVTRKELNAKNPSELADALSDGKVLCQLMDILVPGSIKRVPSRTEERVNTFLQQCAHIGVSKGELFYPLDLINKNNFVQVVYCLHSLGEICHKRHIAPFFTGATRADRRKKRDQWKRQPSFKPQSDYQGPYVPSSELQLTESAPAEDNDIGIEMQVEPIPPSKKKDVRRNLLSTNTEIEDAEELLRQRRKQLSALTANLPEQILLPNLVPITAVTTTIMNTPGLPAPEESFVSPGFKTIAPPPRVRTPPAAILPQVTTNAEPEPQETMSKSNPWTGLLPNLFNWRSSTTEKQQEPKITKPQKQKGYPKTPQIEYRTPTNEIPAYQTEEVDIEISKPLDLYSTLLKLLLIWIILISIWAYSYRENEFKYQL